MKTKAKSKRDNDYYLKRMRVERPDVFADFQAGKFKNVTHAIEAAGLKKRRSNLDALNAAWKKATLAERDAFRALIGCLPPPASGASSGAGVLSTPSKPTTSAAHGKQRLPPALKVAVREIMDTHGLATGDVMREIGRKPLNPSLGRALNKDTQVKDSMVADLEAWVSRNKAP